MDRNVYIWPPLRIYIGGAINAHVARPRFIDTDESAGACEHSARGVSHAAESAFAGGNPSENPAIKREQPFSGIYRGVQTRKSREVTTSIGYYLPPRFALRPLSRRNLYAFPVAEGLVCGRGHGAFTEAHITFCAARA